MKKTILYLILLPFLFLQAFTSSQAADLKLIMYNHTAVQGTQVVVPIRVADFTAMLSIQGSIQFDPAIVSFSSTEQYGLPGMTAGNFGTSQAGSGKLTFSWFDASMVGQTLSDSSIIFAIRFNVTGNPGQQTALNFTGNPTALEFINTSLSPIPYTLVQGSVAVQSSASGGLTIMADNVTGIAGSQVIVPVRVKDFTDIMSIQGSISFSASVATFVTVEQFNIPGMTLSNFGTLQAGSGILTFSWYDPSLTGQTVADSSIIFALRFNLSGTSGQQTAVDFTNSPTTIEFVDNAYATIPATTVSGSIQISSAPASGLAFFPDSVLTPSLTQVSVSVRTSGFADMLSIQGSILFNPAVATYSGISQFGLPGMDINNFGTTQAASGKITFSWMDVTLAGQSLADSSAVFTITFDVIGSPGQHTAISFSDNPTMLEFVDTSFNPITAQLDSGGIYIELPYSISTDSISTETLCDGSAITVYYSTPNVYNSGNIFTAELSDATGDFSTPVEIGNIVSTVSGTINATIPPGTANGSGYRIRVVSSNPSVTGSDNGQDITILQYPSKPGTPTGQSTFCENSGSANYTTSGAANAVDYIWHLEPVASGIISGTGTTATVSWNSSFTGNANIFTTGNNGICTGSNSDTLTITINPVYSISDAATMCEGDSYIFGTQTLTTTGTYTETFTSINGCDSVVTLNLTVNPVYAVSDAVSICNGQSYIFGTQTLITTGTYTETFTSVNGCDSVVTLDFTVNPVYAISDAATICEGDSYAFGTQTLITTGTYTEAFASVNGCDSLVTLNLVVNPAYNVLDAASICQGDSYVFGTQTLTTTGTYTETFTSVNGCDSVVTLTFTANPVYNISDAVSICDGDSYNFGTQTLTTTGTYTETFTSINGCDSVVTLDFTVNPVYAISDAVTICQGQNYIFGTQTLTTTGVFTETFQSIAGCDSVVTLTLTVNPVYATSDIAAICEGDNFIFGTQTLTATGIYTETFTSINGCDSIETLNLTVNPVYNTSDAASVCEGDNYIFGTQTLTTTGAYTETFTSVNGCDSVVTLNLTVNPVYNIPDAASICDGENYPFGTQTLTTAGTYTETFASIAGCDSVVTLTLTVNPIFNSTVTAGICNGETYTLPDGTNVTTGGTYNSVLSSANGCDSTITTELTIHPVYNQTENIQICAGNNYELPDGTTVNTDGTYTSNLNTIYGCDSIITTNLTVTSQIINNIFASICEGDSYFAQGALQTNSGIYYDTTLAVFGCDSIIITNLTVNPVYNNTISVEICEGDTYMLGTQALTTAGSYAATLATVNGCDSIVNLTLTVNPVYVANNNTEICEGDSIFLENNWQMSAGTYYDTLQTISGCDSIFVTTLTVNPSYSIQNNAEICDGETYTLPDATVVTVSGTYTTVFATGFGCDSIITTNLTVNPVYNEIVSAGICEGETYILGTQTLTASGDYTETFTSLSGCDSVVTVTLTVNPVYVTSDDVTICEGDSYMFGIQTLTVSGTYTETFASAFGCDSVVTLNLTVNPTYLIPLFTTICEGDSVFASGAWQYNTGTYSDSLQTVLGCDSVIVTQLTVNSVQYSVINDAICEGQSYTFGSQILTTAGTYFDTLTTIQGCDSLVTLNLIVDPAISVDLGAEDTLTLYAVKEHSGILDAGNPGASYLWNTGDTTQVIYVIDHISGSGLYTFWVQVSNGSCTASDTINIWVDIIGNVNSVSGQNNLVIYPNPSDGSFTIESSNNAVIKIYNSIGELVYIIPKAQKAEILDFSIMPKGLYMVNVRLESGETISRKLIIK